jgi:putative endonuclease
MTNPGRTVIYTGVTNDLCRRVFEHRNKLVPGFTQRYNATRLVYYEVATTPYAAISREKQIKAGPRRRKLELIEGMNPTWRDMGDQL